MHKSAGKGSDLSPLVAFYSKLPKSPAAEPAVRGIKARYFNGKNASASPIVFTLLALFGLGYTIDYQSELALISVLLLFSTLSDILTLFFFFSAPEYVPITSRMERVSLTHSFFLTEHHKNHAH
jgi:F1-F0 ATP synthase subunit F-like protein